MYKKESGIVFLFAAIFMIIAAIGTASATSSISVSPSVNSVNPGDNFTVDILINPDTTPVFSGEFKLLFNPAMLQVISKPASGGFLAQDGASSLVVVSKFDNKNGTVEYGETRIDVGTGVTGAGTLTSVKFHVLNNATPGMTSVINLDSATLVTLVDSSPVPINNVAINNGSAFIPCNAFVNIAKPSEGQVLTTTTVNAHYDNSGCLNLVSHSQLQLDSGPEVSNNTGDITFTGVGIGPHTLKAWLVDASNNRLPGAFDMVNFSVALRGPMVNVTPRQKDVFVGQTFTIDITVNPDTVEVYGAQFDLNYTFPALNATSIVKGPFLTQDGASSLVIVNKCDNSISQCSYAESRVGVNNGVTTPGKLATITFKAEAVGTVPLNLGNVILSNPSADGPIEGVILNSGSVNIKAVPPTNVIISVPTEGQVIQGQTISVNYQETGFLANVNHADLQLDDQPVVHDSDNDGNYAFNGVNYGNHKIQIWLKDASENKIAGAYDIVNFSNAAPTHGPKINVTPAYSSVKPGDIIRINITLNPDTIGSYAASVKLLFNKSMLEVLDLYEGNVLKQDGAATIVGAKKFDNVLGSVEYAESRAGTDTGVMNEGTLFQIMFRVKPVARGSVGEIDLISGIVLDPDLKEIAGVTLNDGKVEFPPNKLPVAVAKTNHSENNVGYKVYLDGSDSYDIDGFITIYEWNFDDGTPLEYGPLVKHVYGNHKWNGTAYESYNVKLRVTDNEGAVNATSIRITPWIAGDMNGDGVVNIFDLAKLGKSWNTHYGDLKYSDGADINNDNVVNVLDLVILGLNWGNTA